VAPRTPPASGGGAAGVGSGSGSGSLGGGWGANGQPVGLIAGGAVDSSAATGAGAGVPR